ncbi:hypothetical protein [Lacticaseibacillus mingshuiensis]|uniref:hypothetical protein n=1 Tax=Lacticaseibacillus mingshuiensis TaxID=2799574 RepID=UPI0019505D73|nr:hypothetical protein [Lacticaseibacillus mingshuiensis]
MAIFKNAKQVIIPESMVDTKSWISDEEIAAAFFGVNAMDLLNLEVDNAQSNNHKVAGVEYDTGHTYGHTDFSYFALLGDAA